MTEPEVRLPESRLAAIEEFQASVKNVSKLVRKTALEKLLRETFHETADNSDQLKVVYRAVSSAILRAMGDESEACRAVATHIVESFVKRLDMNDYELTYIMPAIVKRIGRPEIVEESEELRLALVSLVHTIIERVPSATLSPFISDLTSILCKTITDPFPDVRVETATCITLVADRLRSVFRMNAESYVKPLLPSLSHQQYKVRVAAVRSIGAVVMYGTAQCLELCVTPLAEKLFDEMPAVRTQVLREVGEWMLHQYDRYSYWHRMLPIILTSLFDFHQEIREEAAELWDKIGRQFMEENEQDLKKITDFLENEPVLDYPEGVARPNLGCRTLVQRNIGKILPAIVRECEGWQPDARYRVVQLLRALLLCAERGATQHAPVVVACLQRAAHDHDPRVKLEMEKAAEYFGIFIDPETWWPLLKPDIESWSTVLALAFIALGAKKKLLQKDSAVLKEIFAEVSDPGQCQTRKIQHQQALLSLSDNIVQVLREEAVAVSCQLFTSIFTVYVMSEGELKERALAALEKQRTVVHGYDSLQDLYAEHIGRTLASITTEPVTWTDVSPHYSILYTVVTEFGSALGHELPALTRLLRDTLTEPKLDAKVKVKLFNALSAMLLEKQSNLRDAETEAEVMFYRTIRQDVIMPHLVWSAGMTSESVRCAAISCLCCLLQSESDTTECEDQDDVQNRLNNSSKRLDGAIFESEEERSQVTTELAAVLPSLLDDRSALTRQRAIVAAMCCAEMAHSRSRFSVDNLHKMYFAILRRLDDSSDQVRCLAASAVAALFRCRPDHYDRKLYSAHIDAVYSTLLVHLDDPDSEFRDHVLKCLEDLSDLDPDLLLKKVTANLPLYRNKEAFQSLQEALSKINIAS